MSVKQDQDQYYESLSWYRSGLLGLCLGRVDVSVRNFFTRFEFRAMITQIIKFINIIITIITNLHV